MLKIFKKKTINPSFEIRAMKLLDLTLIFSLILSKSWPGVIDDSSISRVKVLMFPQDWLNRIMIFMVKSLES